MYNFVSIWSVRNANAMSSRHPDPAASEPLPLADSPSLSSWLDLVQDQVASLKFGTVSITVHDRRVVQVERNERFRLSTPIVGHSNPPTRLSGGNS